MTPFRFIAVFQVNLKLCLVEIFSNMTRSVISSLGIFLGTASLLVNLTFVRGMEADLQEQMAQMGGVTILSIERVEAEDREQAIEFTRSGGLKADELIALSRSIDGIESVLPSADLYWTYVSAGGKGTGSRATAVSYRYGEIYNYGIKAGRDLIPEDFDQRARVCLVGTEISNRLFGFDTGALNQRVNVRGIPFTVVGILDAKDKFDRRSRELQFPYSTYQVAFGSIYERHQKITIKVSDVSKIDHVEHELERQLTALHRGARDFEIVINRDKIAEMETASLGMRILILAIAIISLTVGAVSIMNTMFGTIGDRIREIGVRKALGARRVDVFLQFLSEAVLLSLVGGIPGLLLGISFTLFPEGTFPFTPQLGAFDYVLTIVFVVLAGLVSGLFPAIKASEMEPVEALRY